MSKQTLLLILVLLSFAFCYECSNDNTSQLWEIDNLTEIGGHPVTVLGNPVVVEGEYGKAVEFDGDGDLLLVHHNPIGDATSFTVEVVFKPYACYPENTAPRFIHIQDPDDKVGKRLMIELRINEHNQCYLDGFMKTDTSSLVLIDASLVHPTEEWLHAAIIYENGIMTTYMNGEKELSGQLGYDESLINPVGKVAIGGRMNKVNWFNGLIRTLKITDKALEPTEFIVIE